MIDRWQNGPDGPRLNGSPLHLILDSLEHGEPPDRLAERLNLEPRDVLEAIAAAGLGAADDDDGPPLVTGNPPRPRLENCVGDRALTRLLPDASQIDRLNVQAGLCQILDFWELSHQAAQEADDLGERGISACWHGIGHRREPDPANAAHWFRRAGRRPLFATLARAAGPLLTGPTGSAIADRLIHGGLWDPFEFINLCCRSQPDGPEAKIARKLQRLECRQLLKVTIAEAVSI